MLRLFRAGSKPGSPGPAVRILAVLVAVGMLVSVSPFVAVAVAWVIDLL
jgi:hypothetical protein